MKALIVCVSVSHGNTRKIATAMLNEFDGEIVEPEQVDVDDLAGYDVIGFGSGIYGMAFHRRLFELIRRLPPANGQKAFVFATRGGPKLTSLLYVPPMVRLLRSKGFDVIGTFTCLGFDTWLPLRVIGGLNRGHPNDNELDAAQSFAAGLAKQHRSRHARQTR